MVTTAAKEVVTQFLQLPPTFIEYRDAPCTADKEQVQRVVQTDNIGIECHR